MNDDYLKGVFQMLTSNPTSQNLDALIEAYARVGYLASEAETAAEEAANVRKHEEASEWVKAKQGPQIGGRGVSDDTATKMAMLATFGLKQREIEAQGKARKIENLLEALRECLWSIRHLGKYDSSTINISGFDNG